MIYALHIDECQIGSARLACLTIASFSYLNMPCEGKLIHICVAVDFLFCFCDQIT